MILLPSPRSTFRFLLFHPEYQVYLDTPENGMDKDGNRLPRAFSEHEAAWFHVSYPAVIDAEEVTREVYVDAYNQWKRHDHWS